MRMGNDGTLSVNHPWYVTKNEVLRFIQSNVSWIETRKNKINERRTSFHFNQEINTLNYKISILPTEKGNIRAGISKKSAVIVIPSNTDISDPEVQDYIRKTIIRVCRRDAKEYLPSRVRELANIHGFNYNQVYVKLLKSKWGSCSSLGNINLNLFLMLQHSHLIDYIILHELSHTKEHNHSGNFWLLLNKITEGKAKELDKEIKNAFLFKTDK